MLLNVLLCVVGTSSLYENTYVAVWYIADVLV